MPGKFSQDKQRNQWFYENYDGESEPIKINTDIKEGVFISNCSKTIFIVESKTKSIALSNCKEVGLVCNDVIARINVMNCNKTQVQTTGTVPIVQLDKSDRITLYVSEACLKSDPPISFLSSGCTGTNILSPRGEDEDMLESPVPESIRSTYTKDGKFTSVCVIPGEMIKKKKKKK